MRQTNTVAVRLRGGIGDHLLGMRVLRFIRTRWPDHQIVAYSDACGIVPQMQVVAMSPLVSNVVPLYRASDRHFHESWRLNGLREADVEMMMTCDRFIDAAGEGMFAAAARTLDTPIFDILASRPELCIPEGAQQHADSLLAVHDGAVFVGLHLSKYGPDVLATHRDVVVRMLTRLLEDPNVVVLNLYATCYDAVAWPEGFRITRVQQTEAELRIIRSLNDLNERVYPCANLPIATTMALIQRCSYFLGVDSGIKHLAWALGVPHSFFLREKPSIERVLVWMPDIHRMLLFQDSDEELTAHIEYALSAISSGRASHAPATACS